MPTADDLFRPTVVPAPEEERVEEAPEPAPATEPESAKERKPSGRVRHDEKMTVYITSEELLALEHARLSLRSGHGLAVDRGRLVRAAVAGALADLDENGEDSDLVRRLTQP